MSGVSETGIAVFYLAPVLAPISGRCVMSISTEFGLQYGLYSSFMACFAYAVLGTSKDIAIGPVAIVSLLVSSFALSPIPGDATYAIMVSLIGGAIQVAIGLLHIGETSSYIDVILL